MERPEFAGRLPATAIASVAVLLLAVGCATDGAERSTPAFETEPVSPSPHIRIQWRRTVDHAAVGGYRARQYASPVVEAKGDEREVLVGTDSGRLYRVRAGDGEVRWETDLDGGIHADPLPDGDRVYVGTLHGTFYAIDRDSGEVDWKVENEREIESAAATGDGIVFYTTNAGRLVAVDASSGETAWTYSRSIPKEFTIKGSGTPVVADHTVYCGFADGTVAALDSRTGRKNWEADVSGGKTDFTDVDGPVLVRGDRIYAASYGAGVTALDRESGSTIWSREFDNVADAAHAAETLYLAIASGRVVALNAEDGKSKWGFALTENLPVGLVPTGAYVFVSTADGPLYVLDRSTGYPLLEWRPSSGVNTAVAFSRRAGFLLSNKGYLYSFRVAY